MTDFELHGPWTGNALHAPALPPRIAHRRARFWRLFAVAAVLIVISGALAGLSH